jgi:hypothetical protein
MSLIHRVTSIDGQDRDYHGGTVKSIRRVISYDAFHPTEELVCLLLPPQIDIDVSC